MPLSFFAEKKTRSFVCAVGANGIRPTRINTKPINNYN